MSFFGTFNADIFIVLIVIAILLLGIYYGVFKQLRSTIKLVVPFIGIYFLTPLIVKGLCNLEWYNIFIDKVLNWFRAIEYKYTAQIIFYSVILYALIYTIVSLFFKAFKKNDGKMASFKKSKFLDVISRCLGFVISTVSAYVVVITFMFMTSITTNVRHDGVITKLVYKLELKEFEISKLNKYQNVIPTNYVNLEDDIKLINGDKVKEGYDKIKSEIDVVEINLNSFRSMLGDESKKLLENEKIYDFIISDDEAIYNKILENEKDNQNLKTIKNVYNLLKEKQGYVEIFYKNKFDKNLTGKEFISAIINQEEIIKNSSIDSSIKAELIDTIRSFVFYNTYKSDLYKLVYDDSFNDDIITYNTKMNNVFVRDDLLKTFSQKFIEKYDKGQNIFSEYYYTFYNLKNYFKLYLNSAETYNKLNSNMSITTKLILVEFYDDLVSTKEWENLFTVQKYMCDALKGNHLKGHDFYTEYLFYQYITVSFSDEDKLDSSDLDTMLSNIESLEVLDYDSLKCFVSNIFIKGEVLRNINSYIDESFIEAINTSNNKYFNNTQTE